MWLRTLEDAGLHAELTDGGRRLVVDGMEFAIRRLARVRPSEVPTPEPGVVLFVPSVSTGTAELLNRTAWSWITDDGRARLRLNRRWITLVPSHEKDGDPAQRGSIRMSPAERAVLGCLLDNPVPHRQVEIAAATGVTQAWVSKVLNRAVARGTARRTQAGWVTADAGELFDVLAGAAVTPVVEQRWFHLEPGREQVDIVMESARSAGARARLSGDWAADILAPWRLPGLVVIHSDRTLDLKTAGFVPASAEEATVVTLVHDIRDSWNVAPFLEERLGVSTPDWPLAPIEAIAQDILRTGGADAAEALSHLRTRFLAARAELEAS